MGDAHDKSKSSSYQIARQAWSSSGIRGIALMNMNIILMEGFYLGGTITSVRDSIGYGF